MWSPSDERIKSSQMYNFIVFVNNNFNLSIQNFDELHDWSIQEKNNFWSAIWDYFKVIGIKGEEPYINPKNKMPGSKFFSSKI